MEVSSLQILLTRILILSMTQPNFLIEIQQTQVGRNMKEYRMLMSFNLTWARSLREFERILLLA